MKEGDYLEQDLAIECGPCMERWRARWNNDPGTHTDRARFAYVLGMEHSRGHRGPP